LAAKVGWTTYRVLNPVESDPTLCEDGESPLLCEYRILQPSVALIMFGTNDVSVLDPNNYRANLNQIVQLTEARGIIPILSTIPVRIRYEAQVVQFNQIIVDVAAQHAIPLVDYGGAMLPLGSDGFDLDKVHPSVPPKGYAGAADFRTDNLYYGYVIRNLTALQMLDLVWQATNSN
ncbi:MAG: SGNH/GDSL hydrolase family protein, partial [Chloroflexota bacterium]